MILIGAADAEEAATISAAWIALGAGLAGVVLTLLGGLVGAWIQHKRERSTWMRDRRYEAYLNMLSIISRWIDHQDRTIARNAALEELYARFRAHKPPDWPVFSDEQNDEELQRKLDALAAIQEHAAGSRRLESDIDAARIEVTQALQDMAALNDQILDRMAAVEIVGPKSVRVAAGAVLAAQKSATATGPKVDRALKVLRAEMQSVLRLKD